MTFAFEDQLFYVIVTKHTVVCKDESKRGIHSLLC